MFSSSHEHIPYISTSYAIMFMQFTRGSWENEDSDLVGLESGLRYCLQQPGDVDTAHPWTTLWEARFHIKFHFLYMAFSWSHILSLFFIILEFIGKPILQFVLPFLHGTYIMSEMKQQFLMQLFYIRTYSAGGKSYL